jgi:hypothetical protein
MILLMIVGTCCCREAGIQTSKPTITPLTLLPLPCPPWEFPLLLLLVLSLALHCTASVRYIGTWYRIPNYYILLLLCCAIFDALTGHSCRSLAG